MTTTQQTLRFISRRDGLWVLEGEPDENPRTFISRDDTFQTECDTPHPMKFSRQEIADWQALSHWEREHRFSHSYNWAMQQGKKGYLCDGDAQHYYSQWTVMWDSEWTDEVYETFGQAVAAVETATGKKVVRVAPRKPKPAPESEPETGVLHEALQVLARADDKIVNGRRVWASCGHPAELDINNDCYTCHQAVA